MCVLFCKPGLAIGLFLLCCCLLIKRNKQMHYWCAFWSKADSFCLCCEELWLDQTDSQLNVIWMPNVPSSKSPKCRTLVQARNAKALLRMANLVTKQANLVLSKPSIRVGHTHHLPIATSKIDSTRDLVRRLAARPTVPKVTKRRKQLSGSGWFKVAFWPSPSRAELWLQ